MNYSFTTRDILITTGLLSAMALVGGMLFQGISNNSMLSFILAANMAPLGVAIGVFWILKIVRWSQSDKNSSDF